jgi:hypothetical protein
MIRYYAYYSFGGYKDMLLGNSDMKDVREVFYSPFYEQWRKNDTSGSIIETMSEQMNKLDQKQHITILTKENSSLMPSDALTFVTHSGFELACCRSQTGQTIVAIKNLRGEMRDEYDRDIPFMLQFISDDENQMLLLCEFVRQHWPETVGLLSGLFAYNVGLNALQCNLGILNDWVTEVLANSITLDDVQEYCRLPLVVISNGVSVDYLAKELGFNKRDFGLVYSLSGEVVYKKSCVRMEHTDIAIVPNNSFNLNVESVMMHLKKILFVTPEDKEDYEQIRLHTSNIINRRIHRK